MKPAGLVTFACTILLATTLQAHADDGRSLLTTGAGVFDLNDDYTAANFGVEWRGPDLLWTVRPLVGAAVTTDAGAYGYAGIALDVALGNHLVITPNFAPALYEKGNGKDLGYWLEFRSGIEVAWRFEDESRLGVALHHLSHAGLGKDNPGTETLMLNYSIPTDRIFGH